MIQLRPTVESVRPHLEAALSSPTLPARAALAGQQLLARLTSPIRVAILGHPGSGKSQLLNLIAGERIVPEGSKLPSIELRFGHDRRATLIDAEDRETPRPFAELARIGRGEARLVRIEAPLPVLSALTLIEVATQGTAEDERDGVQWAAARADVVIWCSQAFTPAEQWLWSAMPDRLKDHGFLVLTKADELIRAGTLGARIAELEDIVAEEFHSLVPVATLQGLAALCAPTGTDREALAASGAEALIAALLAHVEQGRRADLDAALLFLSRFGPGAPAAEAPAAPAPAPAPEPETAAAPAPAPAPQAAEAGDTVRADAGDTVVRALDILRGCAGTLRDRLGEAGHDDEVLEGCAQAAQAVADTLDPATAPQLHDEAMEVAEMLVLYGLERSEAAAADAVTLLLQLRRDLVAAQAA
jgi:energy-coupling factor transporter ATP-binding protein EcfA2